MIARKGAILIPYIDYGLCEGCAACAELFPDIFEMRDEKAWVINLELFDIDTHKGVEQEGGCIAFKLEHALVAEVIVPFAVTG